MADLCGRHHKFCVFFASRSRLQATVTDLLTPEQYTKASGLVGVAGSAKYLISPVLAGLLLTISDIRLLLL